MQILQQPVHDRLLAGHFQTAKQLGLLPRQAIGERNRIGRVTATRFGQPKPFFEDSRSRVELSHTPSTTRADHNSTQIDVHFFFESCAPDAGGDVAAGARNVAIAQIKQTDSVLC